MRQELGRVVQIEQVLAGDAAHKMGAAVHLELVDDGKCVLVQPALASGQDDVDVVLVALDKLPDGAHEGGHVLAWLDGADKEDKGSVDAVAVADLLPGLGLVYGTKDGAGGLVDNSNLVLGHAQVLDGVVLGALRDGNDVIGPTHGIVYVAVIAGALLGQKVGIEQKGQVVHSDDRTATGPVGRNKVRAVQHIEAQAHQLDI